jgi:hypothetical protein
VALGVFKKFLPGRREMPGRKAREETSGGVLFSYVEQTAER